MKPTHTGAARVLLFGILWAVMVLAGCSKPYRLNVAYVLPPSTGDLGTKRVVLVVEDKREKSAIFSETAQKEFELWDGTFALVKGDVTENSPVVANDLASLFKEALRQRLTAMGVDVISGTIDDAPLFKVSLTAFRLDLSKRTWVSDVSFTAQLSRDNRNIASEKVSAQAERTKLMGKGAGEQLLGEIFSDSVNRLDIRKLFDKAGL